MTISTIANFHKNFYIDKNGTNNTFKIHKNIAVINSYPISGVGGNVYIYEKTCKGWEEKEYLSVPDYVVYVGIEDNTIVIGTKSEKGSVYIYEKFNKEWLLKQTLEGQNNDDFFGQNLELSGSFLAITSSALSCSIGKVYIYKKIRGIWELDVIFGEDTTSYFGSALSISNNYLCISDERFDNYKGKIYLYENIRGVWKKTFEKTGSVINERYGQDISIQNNILTVVSGAMRNTGKLEIFEKENNEWKLKHIENFPNYFNINGTTSTSDSRNRYNVSINNNYIVCGNVSNSNGLVLIAERKKGLWNIKNNISGTNSKFKSNISFYGEYILSGSMTPSSSTSFIMTLSWRANFFSPFNFSDLLINGADGIIRNALLSIDQIYTSSYLSSYNTQSTSLNSALSVSTVILSRNLSKINIRDVIRTMKIIDETRPTIIDPFNRPIPYYSGSLSFSIAPPTVSETYINKLTF